MHSKQKLYLRFELLPQRCGAGAQRALPRSNGEFGLCLPTKLTLEAPKLAAALIGATMGTSPPSSPTRNGNATRDPVDSEIITELEGLPVKFIVLAVLLAAIVVLLLGVVVYICKREAQPTCLSPRSGKEAVATAISIPFALPMVTTTAKDSILTPLDEPQPHAHGDQVATRV